MCLWVVLPRLSCLLLCVGFVYLGPPCCFLLLLQPCLVCHLPLLFSLLFCDLCFFSYSGISGLTCFCNPTFCLTPGTIYVRDSCKWSERSRHLYVFSIFIQCFWREYIFICLSKTQCSSADTQPSNVSSIC